MLSLVKIENKIDILGNAGQKLPKNSLKRQFYENIWKFKTRELQIRYQWNLPSMCITLTAFIHENWERQSKGGRGCIQKSIKRCQDFIKILKLISLKNSL